MRSPRPKPQRQLYFLLNTISEYVPNRDERGSLVGYAVLASLTKFRSESGDQEEVHFEEVKTIFGGLEDAINQCKTVGGFSALCDYQIGVDHKIQDYRATEPVVSNTAEDFDQTELSPLLASALVYLETKRGNPEDIIRRQGLKLIDYIESKGPMRRTKDILTKDYKAVKRIFTGGGR